MMTPQFALEVVLVLLTAVIGLMAWSLKRNVRDVDEKLTSVATDVRQLSAAVSTHGERLAKGDEKLESFERRVTGLEERERERGCFGSCRLRDGTGG